MPGEGLMDRKKNASNVQELKGTLEIDKMLATNEHKYLMINLLSQRARALNDGARPLVELDGPATPMQLAIAEGRAGALKVVKRGEKGAKSEGDSQENKDGS